MRCSSLLIAVAVLVQPACGHSEDRLGGIEKELRACRTVVASDERLKCFDAHADRLTPPKFEGRRNAVTESFTIDRPHILRFHSEGVIFVLYLKDAAGNVVQNLHIGGGGEDTYRIGQPGTYFLQINGAEGWRIWLTPE